MNRLASAAQRLRWLSFPSLALLSVLQRAPALRCAVAACERWMPASAAVVARAGAFSAAALGAVHTLAGATTVATTSANPLEAVVGVPITAATFTPTGVGVGGARSWQISGSLPPGLTFAGLAVPGMLNTTGAPALSGTPIAVGTFIMQVQAWEGLNGTGAATSALVFTVHVAASASAAPRFTTQPASRTAAPGETVTFSAAVAGAPTPTLQWRKNGSALAGATTATLTLASVAAADAASYDLVASNPLGTATSAAVTLTVGTTLPLPVFTRQPQAQTIARDSTAVFTCATAASAALQWQRDGTAIAGATSPMLIVRGAEARPGSYRALAGTAPATSLSDAATLTVSGTANFGHLGNLSILTAVGPGEPYFTVGTVIAGGAAGATKPLLVRAVGPSLARLEVPGVLPDPRLDLFAGGVRVAGNDNWGGSAALSAVFTAVGAFPFLGANSLDAALYDPALPARDYTVQVSGAAGASGAVIAELYDATPGAAFGAATPRLVNVSVLKRIEAGVPLTAGFVLAGETARTVLVRAIGPGLAGLGVSGGFVPDPRLALFNLATQAQIAENDDWGGDPQLAAIGLGVGAFAVANPQSKDAMLLLTLPPGNYTAQVSAGTTGGLALVEVYEVP